MLILGISHLQKLSGDGDLTRSFVLNSLLLTVSLLRLPILNDNNFLNLLAIAIFCASDGNDKSLLPRCRLKTGPLGQLTGTTSRGWPMDLQLTNAYQISCKGIRINDSDTRGEQDWKNIRSSKTFIGKLKT